VRQRLSAALKERAILDVLAGGRKTTSEIVEALTRSGAPTSAWNVRHVLRVLRSRELVTAQAVPVLGQDAPVLEWTRRVARDVGTPCRPADVGAIPVANSSESIQCERLRGETLV
jgi:hypothetical protein